MFWRKKKAVSPPSPHGPAGFWLCDQVLLALEPLPGGVQPDFSHRLPDGHLTVHGFSSPIAARELRAAQGARLPDMRAPEAMAWLRAHGDEALPQGLAQSLEWNLPVTDRIPLAETLLFVRDLVRPRRAAPVAGGLPLLCIDLLVRAGASSFYVRGWWRNRPTRVTRLTAISPEGLRAELLHGAALVERRDIPQVFMGDTYTGFLACFDLPCGNLLNHGWVVVMEMADGFACEMPVPAATEDTAAGLAALLSDLDMEQPPNLFGVAGHIDRAVSLLLARRRALCLPVADLQFGSPPAAPQLSVIVPLYRRTDFLEHQLVAFAQDPDWRKCELIYVLDSPELAAVLRPRAEALFVLYQVPFRLIVLGHNGGYAIANNLAAREARADLLLLLNSDVLPVAPGWIPRLIAAYRRRNAVGALGPKLLYEDGSIQHAGMDYRPLSDGFGWGPEPLFKGMHRDLAAANHPRRVIAVTGACLLVGRADFFRVGGFDEGYIQGDYEDLDLCHRLAAAGLHNWYEPGVELYHLEGASYPSAQRRANALYNRWRHSQAWGDEIAAAMGAGAKPAGRQQAPEPPAVPAPKIAI